jgi:hypothetical protein
MLAIAIAWQSPHNQLILQPEQRQGLAPGRLALLAITDLDRRIAVVVAGNAPLEAQRPQGRRLSPEVSGHGLLHRGRRLHALGVCHAADREHPQRQ